MLRVLLLSIGFCCATTYTVGGFTIPYKGHCERFRSTQSVIPRNVIERTIPLQIGIGRVHEGVTTTEPQAQLYYDQGLTFLYAYEWIDAARSFKEALHCDPKLAMAHMGLSYAFTGLGDETAAKEAEGRAQDLEKHSSRGERIRIELRRKQLQSMEAETQGRVDQGYAVELAKALAADPSNEHLLLLMGNASEGTAWARGQRGGEASIAYYMRILKSDADNPPAHHFLIHAYEMAGDLVAATMHAKLFLNKAPGLSHAHHMYGHELLRAGRTNEALTQFEEADFLEEQVFKTNPGARVYDWHYRHNLSVLGSTYAQLGLRRSASRAFYKLLALPSITPADDLYKVQYPAFMLMEKQEKKALFAAGALSNSRFTVGRITGHALSGSAFARLRNVKRAHEELAAAEIEFTKLSPEWRDTVATRMQTLRAQVELLSDKHEQASARLRARILETRSLPGLDAWSDLVFQLDFIGEIAIDAGEWDLARFVAQQLADRAPFYASTDSILARLARHDRDIATATHELELERKARQ